MLEKLMPKILRNFIKFTFAALIAGFSGCYSGFDYSALELDPSNILDYAVLAEQKKVAPGTIEYARFSSSSGSSEIMRKIEDINQSIATEIAALDRIGQKLEGEELLRHNLYIKEQREIIAKIAPSLAEADKTYKASYDLVALVAKGIREYEKGFGQYTQKVPPDAALALKLHGNRLSEAFKKLYQQSLMLALSVPQREILDQVAKIEVVLKSMAFNLEKNPNIVAASNLSIAKKSLVDAESILEQLLQEVRRMNSKNLAFAALENSLARLKQAITKGISLHYLKNIEDAGLGKAPDDAQKLYNEMSLSLRGLETSIRHFEPNDRLKNPHDPVLKRYTDEIFAGAIMFTAPVSLQIETDKNDLVRLVKKLKDHQILGLKRTEDSGELIKALAIAVKRKIAKYHGLELGKVVTINDQNLNTLRTVFSMTDHEFDAYVQAQAAKIQALESQEEHYPNVFVVHADELGENVDIDKIVDTLSKGSDKVIVVTSRPEEYGKGIITANGLDLASGYNVARAVLLEHYPHDRIDEIVAPLVKIFYGLSPNPEAMNLRSLPLAAQDTMLRLGIGKKTILEGVKEALASMPINPIPVHLIDQSRILADSFKTIQINMQRDRSTYRRRGK